MLLFVSSTQVSVAGKAVLITGCDTGFGFVLALHLDALVSGEGARFQRMDADQGLSVYIRKEKEDARNILPLPCPSLLSSLPFFPSFPVLLFFLPQRRIPSSPVQGFRVVAGCLERDGEGAKKLRAAASPRLHILQLDVTSSDDMLRAVQEVEALLPEGGECDGPRHCLCLVCLHLRDGRLCVCAGKT